MPFAPATVSWGMSQLLLSVKLPSVKLPAALWGCGGVGCASLEDISTSSPLSLALLPAATQGSLKAPGL